MKTNEIKGRIEELEEEMQQFVLEHSAIDEDENPSWGDVAEACSKAEDEWDATEEGKELIALKALLSEV